MDPKGLAAGRGRLTLVWSLLFAAIATIAIPPPALAQRRGKQTSRNFDVGDAIEYLWVNEWLPGQVVAVEGNRVGIEYEWGGSARREIVPALKLRFQWEARALTPMRTWRDTSGQFRVRAAVVGLDAETGSVTLYKDDDTEVTVPIDRLSEGDRGLLRKLTETMPPPIPELPPLATFAQSSGIGASAWSSADTLADVSPDPPPAFVGVPMAGVVFPAAEFFEEIVGLMPIGGSSGWMLAGTRSSKAEIPSRLLWVTLSDQKVRQTQMLPHGEALVAVDPPNRQLLTLGLDEERQAVLTLWKADPTAKKAEPRARWTSAADEFASATSWAALVSPDRVLHQWGRQKFIAWDVETKREAYRIDQESFFSAMPVLSPGKKYLALPEDSRVRILEAASGRTLASLPIEGGSAAGVSFDRQGNRLAILTRSQMAIWQLGSADPPQRLRADSVGTPFAATVDWVDDQTLLIDRETLYDIDLQLPVWTYQTATAEVQNDTFGERTLSVVDGKLCYVVVIHGQQKTFVVGAVELPGPQVRETVAQIDPAALHLLKPGDRVKLRVECGAHTPQIQLLLTQQIQKNGWVVDPSAPIEIVAEMGRGKTQTVEYASQMGGGARQSASVTPYFSTVKIQKGDMVAWQSGTSTGLPPVMFLKAGEEAQAKANEMQKPNPQFFQTVAIPQTIFDPTYNKGFGTSTISSRGLVPETIKLPGSAAPGASSDISSTATR